MADWISAHWQIIVWAIGVIASCVAAFFYVTKVKVPTIERRVKVLEDAVLAINNGGVVHKGELYMEDGTTKYVTAPACMTYHTECLRQQKETQERIVAKVCEVKDAVESMEQKRQINSITFHSFMAAVKEKLDLKFTIPKNGGL